MGGYGAIIPASMSFCFSSKFLTTRQVGAWISSVRAEHDFFNRLCRLCYNAIVIHWHFVVLRSITMTAPALVTVIRMMEELPEPVQNQVVSHLQEYLAALNEELKWDAAFRSTQPKLSALAKRARQEIEDGKAIPMDFNRL
jgi:hypothetical protein